MTVYKGKNVQVQAVAMTRDEYIASEHSDFGYYPVDNAPGYLVTDNAHFKAWYTEAEFNFLFEVAESSSGLVGFLDAAKEMARGNAVRREWWPDGVTMRTQGGRFITITVSRGQRIMAPYAVTPADAAAKDWILDKGWVVVPTSALSGSK
jgi:hypothetical protein